MGISAGIDVMRESPKLGNTPWQSQAACATSGIIQYPNLKEHSARSPLSC